MVVIGKDRQKAEMIACAWSPVESKLTSWHRCNRHALDSHSRTGWTLNAMIWIAAGRAVAERAKTSTLI
jgi:hypothetical protein